MAMPSPPGNLLIVSTPSGLVYTANSQSIWFYPTYVTDPGEPRLTAFDQSAHDLMRAAGLLIGRVKPYRLKIGGRLAVLQPLTRFLPPS